MSVLMLLLVLLGGVLSEPARVCADTSREATVGAQAEIEELRQEVEALRGLIADLARQVSRTRPALSSYRLPDSLTFAGQAVPLERWDMAERLEREFYIALAAPAQVVLWLKRSARYFPYIEERLRAAALPDDLKYVAVAESDLRPRAYSWAKASGIWQFVPDTGRRYGLRVTRAWDERRDPERSTAAATAYLRDLYAHFRDWPLALAAYNAGERRVTAALKSQGVSEYYQLKVAELKSRNNSKSVAMPRQVAMYLCKSLTHASLPEIGRSFGGKHHSTVIHSIRKVEELRKVDRDFNNLIGGFLESIR